MAAPNVNGRLHLTGVYQKSPASFKSKLPETREFKGTCHITKKSCTDWGNPTKNKKKSSDQSL